MTFMYNLVLRKKPFLNVGRGKAERRGCPSKIDSYNAIWLSEEFEFGCATANMVNCNIFPT